MRTIAPGDIITADLLNEFVMTVNEWNNISVEQPLEISFSDGGKRICFTGSSFWAVIGDSSTNEEDTSSTYSTFYDFQEILFPSGPQITNGTKIGTNAFEVNDNDLVPSGTYVRLYPTLDGDFAFAYNSGSSSSTLEWFRIVNSTFSSGAGFTGTFTATPDNMGGIVVGAALQIINANASEIVVVTSVTTTTFTATYVNTYLTDLTIVVVGAPTYNTYLLGEYPGVLITWVDEYSDFTDTTTNIWCQDANLGALAAGVSFQGYPEDNYDGQPVYITYNEEQFVRIVNTTSVSSITAGVCVVTPLNMLGIQPGANLNINMGVEFVVVTSVTDTTFTALFAGSYPSNTPIVGAPGTIDVTTLMIDAPQLTGQYPGVLSQVQQANSIFYDVAGVWIQDANNAELFADVYYNSRMSGYIYAQQGYTTYSASGVPLTVPSVTITPPPGTVALTIKPTGTATTDIIDIYNNSGVKQIWVDNNYNLQVGQQFLNIINTAITNASVIVEKKGANSTGTTTPGFGTQLVFIAQSQTTPNVNQSYIESIWYNAVTGSQIGQLNFLTYYITHPVLNIAVTNTSSTNPVNTFYGTTISQATVANSAFIYDVQTLGNVSLFKVVTDSFGSSSVVVSTNTSISNTIFAVTSSANTQLFTITTDSGGNVFINVLDNANLYFGVQTNNTLPTPGILTLPTYTTTGTPTAVTPIGTIVFNSFDNFLYISKGGGSYLNVISSSSIAIGDPVTGSSNYYILSIDGSSNLSQINTSTSGYILTSNGPTSAATFVAPTITIGEPIVTSTVNQALYVDSSNKLANAQGLLFDTLGFIKAFTASLGSYALSFAGSNALQASDGVNYVDLCDGTYAVNATDGLINSIFGYATNGTPGVSGTIGVGATADKGLVTALGTPPGATTLIIGTSPITGSAAGSFLVSDGTDLQEVTPTSGQIVIAQPSGLPIGVTVSGDSTLSTSGVSTTIGIRTVPVSPILPTTGQLLFYNGTEYLPGFGGPSFTIS